MIGEFMLLYVKSAALLAKLLATIAIFIAPAFSAATPTGTPASGHGTAAPHATATPAAAHGTPDAHATPAPAHHEGLATPTSDAHHAPTATPGAPHGDGHAPATGDHGATTGDHAAPAHGDGHAAAGDHGAPGEHHGPAPTFGKLLWGIPSGIWHAINFLILFGAIFFVTRKLIVAGARTKRDATARAIEDAQKLREEMRKKFEDYDARMRNIDQSMSSIVADAKNEAETERAKLVADATALAARTREDAKLIADQEISRARRDLQDEMITLAGQLAEQILESNVTKEDQARLTEEFTAKVAGKEKEGRA